jgi:hypothetical protein
VAVGPRRGELRLVGHRTHQRVPECVARFGQQLDLVDQLGGHQVAHVIGLRTRNQRVQNLEVEAGADDRGGIQNRLLGDGQSVDAGGEYRLDGGWDRDGVEVTDEAIVAAGAE